MAKEIKVNSNGLWLWLKLLIDFWKEEFKTALGLNSSGFLNQVNSIIVIIITWGLWLVPIVYFLLEQILRI